MTDKLAAVELADVFNAHLSPEAQQEQQIAIFDLVEDNVFKPASFADQGPFKLKLNEHEGKLVFEITPMGGEEKPYFLLISLSTFKGPLAEYFDICTAYNDAIHTASAARMALSSSIHAAALALALCCVDESPMTGCAPATPLAAGPVS